MWNRGFDVELTKDSLSALLNVVMIDNRNKRTRDISRDIVGD